MNNILKKIHKHAHLQHTYKYSIKYAHKDNKLHRLVYPTDKINSRPTLTLVSGKALERSHMNRLAALQQQQQQFFIPHIYYVT